MVDIWWLALISGSAGCIWLYRRWTKSFKLPPGPKGWPLVGNALQQDPGRPHLTWTKWAEKYGEVFTINNFGTPLVLCNSSKSIWEMLVTKSTDFAGRPSLYPCSYITDGGRDVLMGDFESHWAYRKKVMVTSAKLYGDGLNQLETIMQDVVKELVEDFQKMRKKPFDPMKPVQLAICNTMAVLLCGDWFDQSDPDFQSLLDHISNVDQILAPSLELFLLDTFPFLHYAPLHSCKVMDRYVNGFLKDWLPRIIQKRKTSYDADNPGCILDALIKQHETDMKTNPKDALEFRYVITMAADLFIGGVGTSAAALYNLMAILTVNPQIQTKVQAEIDKVLGGRHPELQDKQTMSYTQATIEEVLRYAVIINGFPHQATVDSSICGHFIPKGTQVWPNVWHLCHDPEIYEDPWTFKPERFLDANGQFVPPDHPARRNMLVFSAGRRACPGAQLARNRIFLISTSLLQNFVLELGTDDPQPQSDPRSYPGKTFLLKPEPYKIRAIPRD